MIRPQYPREFTLFGLLTLVLAIAIVNRYYEYTNTDVSWLLTLAERLLDGERLSVDFIELNPPGSVLLYVPAVLLARATNLTPETSMTGLFIALAFASLWMTGRILQYTDLAPVRSTLSNFISAEPIRHPSLLFNGALAILIVLPARAFGEREHVGLILELPWFALCSVRLAGRAVAPVYAAIAGLALGLAIVIKPHLAAPVFVVIPFLALRLRNWRIFFSLDLCCAILPITAFAVALMTVFKPFLTETLPLVLEMYVPIRHPFTIFATPTTFLLVGAALALYRMRDRRTDAVEVVLLLAGAAGATTVILQGKGWPYHSYPAVACVGLAVLYRCLRHREAAAGPSGRTPHPAAVSALCVAWFGAAWLWFDQERSFNMQRLVARVTAAAPRPTIALLGSDIAVAFPLTRLTGGRWSMRVPCLWIADGALRQIDHASPARMTKLSQMLDMSRAMFREDLVKSRADVILVDQGGFDWLTWALRDAELAAELAHYQPFDTVESILILRRRGA